MAHASLLRNSWNVAKTVQAFASDPDYIQNTFKFEYEVEEHKKGETHLCEVCYCDYEDDEWV